ncbi:MAG: spermidine synthase [Planctomycetota bacterium]
MVPRSLRPEPRLRPPRAALAAAGAFFLVAAVSVVPSGTRVIYETRSKYNRVVVRENSQGVRYLMFSDTGGYQTVRRPGDEDNLELPYSKVMMVGLGLVPEPRRILVLGLGGGAIPSFLHKRFPRARIDCVDIDPVVVDVAKRYFGFKEDPYLRARVADGRKFVEESRRVYDAIFLDAYGDDSIPIHLATREFLTAARSTVHPRGVILGNVWGRESNALYDSMVRTYQAVFEQLYLFGVPARSNVILLALPRPGRLAAEEIAEAAGKAAEARGFGYDLAELVRSRFHDASDELFDAPILEDENAGL